jgi:hypothetical protein
MTNRQYSFQPPKNKLQEIGFTLLMAGCMVYIMAVYNIATNNNGLTYATFRDALPGFPLEFLVGFLCAFFIASKTSTYLAFRIVTPKDRPIVQILAISIFTVCTMVPLMSLFGIFEANGFTSDFILIYVTNVCKNFIMALPLNIFLVGPLMRRVFNLIFYRRAS